MNIIFLDVDGVLNSMQSFKEHGDYIDPKAVKNLRRIVEATSASIVLTSSWRSGWSKDPLAMGEEGEILVEALAKEGLEIMDKTGFSTVRNMSGRSLEVLEWLENTTEKIDHFVILDDANFHWKKYKLGKYWVRTNFKDHGLTKEHADKAIGILQGKSWLRRLFS